MKPSMAPALRLFTAWPRGLRAILGLVLLVCFGAAPAFAKLVLIPKHWENVFSPAYEQLELIPHQVLGDPVYVDGYFIHHESWEETTYTEETVYHCEPVYFWVETDYFDMYSGAFLWGWIFGYWNEWTEIVTTQHVTLHLPLDEWVDGHWDWSGVVDIPAHWELIWHPAETKPVEIPEHYEDDGTGP